LETPSFAPKVQKEGSQWQAKRHLWSKGNSLALLQSATIVVPRLQRGNARLTLPDVSRLAIFFVPLRGSLRVFKQLLRAEVQSSSFSLLGTKAS
jgi:hypothetical protein